MLEFIRAASLSHVRQYNQQQALQCNRLNNAFFLNFTVRGAIQWNKLMAYSAGENASIKLQRAVVDSTTGYVVLEDVPNDEI